MFFSHVSTLRWKRRYLVSREFSLACVCVCVLSVCLSPGSDIFSEEIPLRWEVIGLVSFGFLPRTILLCRPLLQCLLSSDPLSNEVRCLLLVHMSCVHSHDLVFATALLWGPLWGKQTNIRCYLPLRRRSGFKAIVPVNQKNIPVISSPLAFLLWLGFTTML